VRRAHVIEAIVDDEPERRREDNSLDALTLEAAIVQSGNHDSKELLSARSVIEFSNKQ
jgi:hypothetical protein